LADIKKQKKDLEKIDTKNVNSKSNLAIENAFFAGMSDSGLDSSDLEIEEEDFANKTMMCCCKQHLIHNESLKF